MSLLREARTVAASFAVAHLIFSHLHSNYLPSENVPGVHVAFRGVCEDLYGAGLDGDASRGESHS